MASGAFHACAITADGELLVWGEGSLGRLGLGNEEDHLVRGPGGPGRAGRAGPGRRGQTRGRAHELRWHTGKTVCVWRGVRAAWCACGAVCVRRETRAARNECGAGC